MRAHPPAPSLPREGPELPDDVLLRVARLRKHFDEGAGRSIRAVNDLSLEVKASETLSLVGESGCGKTTAARCIMRILAPSSGDIWFRASGGATVNLAKLSAKQMRPLRAEMQMIFQDPFSSLNPRMSVRDIVAEPLRIFGLKDRRALRQKVGGLLESVGLRPSQMSRFPNALSGGERQRIGIARALALAPRLIVADEAVSALDVSVQAQILNLLADLQAEQGISFLFVAHDLSVVRHISHQVAVMYVGQIVELADCEALFEQPLHPYTAALLAAVPQLHPRLAREFQAPAGEPPSPRNPPSGCHFHPRCEHATDRCRREAPQWQSAAPGRMVRCHRAMELELPGISALKAD